MQSLQLYTCIYIVSRSGLYSGCRYALRRNQQVLTLDCRFSFQNGSFINHLLDNHPSLHKLSHFDIAADHMIYNREEFQQVMPKDTVYVSSLREPVAQFKSAVNYYGVIITVKHFHSNVSRK